MIGDLRQASHLLRPIDAINGVKNWRRRISILKQALEINCDLKAISWKEADMIGRSPTFSSSKTSQDLRRLALPGQIHTDPQSRSHDFDPDDKNLSLNGQELAQ
ncbi:hypothetical protein P5673_009046 [Acropora cervicornis]|uniref:Uncharacterized protein n=1 Tax=Acropora cervicornis TaxID=6130 RepID=A0AAD9QUA8_ACRCE|nr:hypothetical protein P5673_009046 [Acropora cervicornis]